MVCPACKMETGTDSQFCPHCGANMTTGVAPLAAQPGGLSETAAGVIAYITVIPAIIFLVMDPYNRSPFIRFHAWQSIFFGIAFMIILLVLGAIPILGWILMILMVPVWLALGILWIFVMIKASKGERYKIPFIGNFAEQAAK
jgi:uncharacterized membrane protein